MAAATQGNLFPGSQIILYAEKEGSYGDPRRIDGTNAFKTLSETFTPIEERETVPDRSGSPDHLERFVGRKSAEWSISKLIRPSGSAGTAPDDDFLWENAFGRVSSGATSVSYLFATAHDKSLTLRRGVRTGGGSGVAEFQEHIEGAIANNVEIAWGAQGNNNLAQVDFSGLGQRWGYTGNTSLSGDGIGALATGAGQATIANSEQLTAGSVIKIAKSGAVADTGGGSGILIDTINNTTNVITFSEVLDATHSNSLSGVISPYNPTATTSGNVVHGKLGFLSLDGNTSQILHLGGRVTVEDNRSLLNEEVGCDEPSRVMREDRRNVTFSLDFLMKEYDIPTVLGGMNRNTAQNIQVEIGDKSGSTVRLQMLNAEFNMVALDAGDQSMYRISIDGQALGSAGNDSLKVTFV